ncbi:MAG: AsmA-like C-terminal region-containing protein, partial [Candidatus Zixiibacteriota bacterium]
FEHVLNYYLADSSERSKIKRPLITGNMDGAVNLAVLNTYLAEKRAGQMTGNVKFDLQVSGSPVNLSDLKPHGYMSITGGTLKDTLLPEPIQNLSAIFTVVADTFKVDSMNVQFVSSDVSMKGRVVRPVPYFLTYLGVTEGDPPKPLFELNVKSQRFDVDKMFPEAVPGSEAATEQAMSTTEPSMVIPDMNGTGTFSIDTLIYSQIEFTGINGNFRVQDRKMDCYDVSGAAYAGKVSGKTSIDLNDFASPKYTGEFKATDVEADEFIKRFSKFGGFLFGKIDLNGNYNASGWNRNEFVSSLTMDGLLQMNKGKLVTSGPSYQAMKAIASSLSLQFDQEQAIRSLSTKLAVKNGKVGLDNLNTSLGAVGDIEIGGFYDFNGGLDYKGSVLLSQDYTKKVMSFLTKGDVLGGIGGLFTDKSAERMRLPLLIEGTVDDPKVKVDMGSLGKTAGENLKNKLGNFLLDQFKKDEKK